MGFLGIVWLILGLIIKAVLAYGILHILSAVILLTFGRLKKEPDGTLILDHDSWHFKIAYPFKRYEFDRYKKDNRENRYDYYSLWTHYMAEGGVNICYYVSKFTNSLIFGWPFIILMLVVLILLDIIFLSFGKYVVPNVKNLNGSLNDASMDLKLPRIGKYRILPIYILAPTIYSWCLWQYPHSTIHNTLTVAVGILFIAIVLGIYLACSWLSKTNQEDVSIAREWISAKKKGYCKILKVV